MGWCCLIAATHKVYHKAQSWEDSYFCSTSTICPKAWQARLAFLQIIACYIGHYIMAGRAFVVAKEVFIMETVVFWHCDNG